MSDDDLKKEVRAQVAKMRATVMSGVGLILVVGACFELLIKPAKAQTNTINAVATVKLAVEAHSVKIHRLEQDLVKIQIQAVHDISDIKVAQKAISTNVGNQTKKIDHLQELIEELLRKN